MVIYSNGQGSVILRVKLRSSASAVGAGLTGLTEASAGLIIATIADTESATTRYRASSSEVETIATLGTYAAPTSGKCRFKEIDATNHPGLYEIQLADARLAVSNAKSAVVSLLGATNLVETDLRILLQAVNPYDSVRGGMTALPNAAAEASGGLATLSAAQASNGTINANVHRWLTGTPNALQSGRVDSYLGAVASGVIASASFAANALDAVWSTATRVLTAGTNIVLAKGTGVTGFNDLSAAQVNAEADTALSDAGVTTARTGYLDNLSGGAVALASSLATLAGKFTGITLVAEWLGLIAGKQTGNSTARTELRATGAGSGTFDETTDSQEAIRDRGDSAWTTATGFSTLDAAGVRSAVGLASANLDTQLSAIAGYIDTEVAAILTKIGTPSADLAADIAAIYAKVDTEVAAILAAVDTEVAAIKAKTDNLPAAPAAVGDIPTAVQNADALLGRNLAGGSNGGRTVKDALRVLRNKVVIVPIDETSGTINVYDEADAVVIWSGTVTRAAVDAMTAVDPA